MARAQRGCWLYRSNLETLLVVITELESPRPLRVIEPSMISIVIVHEL